MRTRRFAVAAAVAVLALAAPAGAGAQPVPKHASCAEFGANVAMLARDLGRLFGATASRVATSGAGNFPEIVVRPELERFCIPR